MIAAPFVMMGLGKLAAPGATIDYFAAMGVPVPPLAIVVSVVIELGDALLLLSGYGVRIASLVMAVYCVVTAMFFHQDFADQN